MFTCVAIASFDESGLGFVVPLFSTHGSNQIFAQDLNADGTIRCFVPTSEMPLYPVQALPPSFKVKIGDNGLLGFIDDDLGLDIGTVTELADCLRGKEISDPFTRIEIAALLRDRKLQKAAVSDCVELVGATSASKRWANIEKQTFSKVNALRDDVRSADVNKYDDLQNDLKELEENEGLKDWSDRWIRIWGQNFKRRSLVGLANLRQDKKLSFNRNHVTIFSLIFDEFPHDDSFERLFTALSRTELSEPRWTQAYQKLFRFRYFEQSRMRELGVYKVLEVEEPTAFGGNWVTVWNMTFGGYRHRHEMLEKAVIFVERSEKISQYAARVLLVEIASEKEYFQRVREKARDWVLENIRSDNVWALLFEKSFDGRYDEQIFLAGIDWLGNLGGNLSAWHEIWRMYAGELSEKEHTDLALAWLSRARKDMRAWVNVFIEVFEKHRADDIPVLLSLGEAWLRAGYGNAYNRRRVSDARKYLQNRAGL